MTAWTWRARLPRVADVPQPAHDGDTLRVEIDRGFSAFQVINVRLSDVHAPELSQTGGPAARAYVHEWLERWARTSGKWPFSLDTIRTRDNSAEVVTLNRYVGVLWNAGRTECLNAEAERYYRARGFPIGN